MFIKTVVYLLFTCFLLTGMVSVYRATLSSSDMIMVEGKLLDKEIRVVKAPKEWRFSLVFDVDGLEKKLSINLTDLNESERAVIYHLFQIPETYKFYLDPTGEANRITRVDFKGKAIYTASQNLNHYGGIALSVLSFLGLILFYRRENQPHNTSGSKLSLRS